METLPCELVWAQQIVAKLDPQTLQIARSNCVVIEWFSGYGCPRIGLWAVRRDPWDEMKNICAHNLTTEKDLREGLSFINGECARDRLHPVPLDEVIDSHPYWQLCIDEGTVVLAYV